MRGLARRVVGGARHDEARVRVEQWPGRVEEVAASGIPRPVHAPGVALPVAHAGDEDMPGVDRAMLPVLEPDGLRRLGILRAGVEQEIHGGRVLGVEREVNPGVAGGGAERSRQTSAEREEWGHREHPAARPRPDSGILAGLQEP